MYELVQLNTKYSFAVNVYKIISICDKFVKNFALIGPPHHKKVLCTEHGGISCN